MKLSAHLEQLYQQQPVSWPLARENYKALDHVLVQQVNFDSHNFRLQFNPKRIISSAAKVDPKSLAERPCFLCAHNRPAEQKGIPFLDDYLILLNPYPVFSPHFTVITTDHRPQRIINNFTTMLRLAKEINDYTIIYNGPGCGASAPDHFHFQAIRRNMLPLESEYTDRISDTIIISANTRLHNLKDYTRQVLTLTGKDQQEIQKVFERIYHLLEETLPAADEPMMNILTWFDNPEWIVQIFPRKRHRPSQYFETGDKQILISPASIDLGGVLIIPRLEDYNKISKEDITDIFNQVCVDDYFVRDLMDRLKNES